MTEPAIFLYLLFTIGVCFAAVLARRPQLPSSNRSKFRVTEFSTIKPAAEVTRTLKRIAGSGGVAASAASKISKLRYQGRVVYGDESSIEAEIRVWRQYRGKYSFITNDSRVMMRFHLEDLSSRSQSPLTGVVCEWANLSNNYLHPSKQDDVLDVLNHVTAVASRELASKFILLQTSSPPQIATPPQSIALQPASMQADPLAVQVSPHLAKSTSHLSSPPAESLNPANTFAISIPSRQYKNIGVAQAVNTLLYAVSKGGTLQDPLGGPLALHWEVCNSESDLDTSALIVHTNQPCTVTETIRFSDYAGSSSTSQLSNKLTILWTLRAMPYFDNQSQQSAPGVELSIKWNGVNQVATGDLIRHLIERVHPLLKFAAPPIRSVGFPVGAAPGKVFWPSLQDYNESIQNPQLCFCDQELNSGYPELTVLGLPRVATGAFASVYRIHCGGNDWAVRCFSSPVKDQVDRYGKTSRFICSDDLSYTVPLQYLQDGIRVHGKWFPILKMEWVEGISIYEYIDKYYWLGEKMLQLDERFLKMMDELRLAGIAHSDLQHGNIIIRNDEIVLVDYDGMFVPELSGYLSQERGHPNYQHPDRDARHFGPYLDNFSAWLIDTCLVSLIHDPSLWQQFGSDNESLLFRRADLMNPDQSSLFVLLEKHANREIRERAQYLRSLLAAHITEIPYLQRGFPPLLKPHMDHLEPAADSKKNSGLPDWMR
jgi:hypothetical protein